MPRIIRDAEFKTNCGDGLWPGMRVRHSTWGHKSGLESPLSACYLWRVEQHDETMMLAGEGVEVLIPLTHEAAEDCALIDDPASDMLASYPTEWAALRKLGWGVHLAYGSNYRAYHTLVLECRRGYKHHNFWIPQEQLQLARENPEIVRSLLKKAWWCLKHPRYAEALASQQPPEFWQWPNTPEPKQLHIMGLAAWKTVEGQIEIGPDGKISATGRKSWGLPTDLGGDGDEELAD